MLTLQVGRVLCYSSDAQPNGTKTLRGWKKDCEPTHKITDKYGKEVLTYDGLTAPEILVSRDY